MGRVKNVLIDTSVLIANERKQWNLAKFLEEYVGSGQAGLSAITASEFQEGIYRAPPGKRRDRREELFSFIIDTFPVLPFDLETAKTHAQVRSELQLRGTPIGPHDLIIAATALHLDWEIATLNTNEFSLVHGLVLSRLDAFRE